MASADSPGLFAFASIPTPDGPEAYRTGATMLKALGWIRLVSAGFALLAALAGLLLLFLGGAALGLFANRMPMPAGMGGALLLGIVLVGIAFWLGIAIAVLYWTSWIYGKWTAFDARALVHAQWMAIITIVFAALSVLAALGTFNVVSLCLDGAVLALAIVLLTKLNDPALRQAFGATGMPPLPE